MIPTLLPVRRVAYGGLAGTPHFEGSSKSRAQESAGYGVFLPRSETATQEKDQPCPLLPPECRFGSCSSTTTPSFASCSPSCSAQTSERRSSALPPTARRVPARRRASARCRRHGSADAADGRVSRRQSGLRQRSQMLAYSWSALPLTRRTSSGRVKPGRPATCRKTERLRSCPARSGGSAPRSGGR